MHTRSHRRRLRGWLPVILTVLASTVSAVAGLQHDLATPAAATVGPTTTASPAQADPGGPVARDRELQLLLDRRSRALLAHDERAWLADIDPAATDFAAEQRERFRGLAEVPFAAVDLTLLPGRSYTVPEALRRSGPTAYVAAVVARHRLRGFDSGLTAEPVALTFTRHAGRWWLAADDDADDLLPAGGHAAPWDVTEVAVARSARVLVVGDADDRAELPGLVRRVETAVRAVGAVWPAGGHHWDGKVVVYAVRDPRVVDAYLDPMAEEGTRPAALAVPALDAFAWFDPLATWPAAVGTRVVVDQGLTNADDDLLRHEIAHVASLDLVQGQTPDWAAEGIADWTAYHPADLAALLDDEGVDDATADALDDGTFQLELPFSVRFYDDAGAVDQNYTAGLLACTYVRQRWGQPTLLRLHAELARHVERLDEPDTQEAVLRRVLGLSTTAFERAATRAVQQAWDG